MKTTRKGCLAGATGNQLSSSPSINGDVRKPNTEITGEEFAGQVPAGLKEALKEQIYDLKSLELRHEAEELAKESGFGHITPENYQFDADDFYWQGWMLVGEFADEAKNNPPAKIEFVKVKVDQFDRLTTDDPKLSTLIEGHES